MMKRLFVLNLLCHICYSYSEFAPVAHLKPKTPCDNPNKNSLVEHFFNTIFTEFYSSPPVCVCVQMCPGQSTYCYPNGCLKPANSVTHEKTEAKTETALPTVMQRKKNHFMLVKDERDFMTDFLERNYVDELREPAQSRNPVQDLHPDVFKNKYNIVGKYKKTPTGNLKHNLQEKALKETVKMEGTDWNKTRWPLNRQNMRSGSLFSHIEKPLRKQGTYFAALLHDNEVPEYPPKFFKRELTKTVDDFENKFNVTDGNTFSLDTLIDNLIRSSFVTNTEKITNIAIAKRDDSEIETDATIEKVLSVNSTSVSNETTRVISMNFTNENVEKNKYLDVSQTNETADLSAMITHLSNQIEVQNNTSMEIARRTIKDFDELELKPTNIEEIQSSTTTELIKIKSASNPFTNKTTEAPKTVIINESTVISTEPEHETVTLLEKAVTRKNRQKVVKKSGSSKMN